jgi:hypothetical protein
MNNASDLKKEMNMTTGMLVLLNIITLGIYPVIWMYKHAKVANAIVGDQLYSDLFVTVQAVLVVLNVLCLFTGYGSIFGLIAGIVWVIWAFKAKNILTTYAAKQLGIDLRMNSVWTFFFTVFYVQYCINDLPNAAARQTALRAV